MGNKYRNLQMNKLQNDLLLEYTGKQLLRKEKEVLHFNSGNPHRNELQIGRLL